MNLGEHIHWFLTDRCNMKCLYCFREYFSKKESTANLIQIAKILADNDVKRVTFGGGEPTLIKKSELGNVLQVLKEAGIFIDLHTNCLTLTKERLRELKGLVDKIGIPIDTLDDRIQTYLRDYPSYVKLVKKVARNAQKLDFKIVYHTVATYLNIDKVPEIYYRFIKKTDFDCWKIYEYNEDLARQTLFQSKRSEDERISRFSESQALLGPGNFEKGCSDGLLAKILLTEEKMKKRYNDDRIKFICKGDYQDSYFFINNTGDAGYFAWYSKERMKVSNVFEEPFPAIVKKFRKLDEEGWPEGAEQFFATLADRPIFARLYEGNYAPEEIDMIEPRYDKKVQYLANLWEIKKYGKAMT